MGNYWAVDVEINGLVDVLSRLREFDRKAYDAMTSELEDAGSGIVSDARNIIPAGNALSHWGGWNAHRQTRRGGIIMQGSGMRPIPFSGTAARAGVKAKAGKKFRKGRLLATAVTVQQMNAGGAIWELAGSTKTVWGATGGAATFRQNLNEKHGDKIWPRSLTPAWHDNVDQARDRIDSVITKYAKEASSD